MQQQRDYGHYGLALPPLFLIRPAARAPHVFNILYYILYFFPFIFKASRNSLLLPSALTHVFTHSLPSPTPPRLVAACRYEHAPSLAASFATSLHPHATAGNPKPWALNRQTCTVNRKPQTPNPKP